MARILVVDDEANNRAALARRLTQKGYIVEVAEDGPQAPAARALSQRRRVAGPPSGGIRPDLFLHLADAAQHTARGRDERAGWAVA